MINDLPLLRLMVRGAYDLQAVRMQVGLRLCANFRSRLGEPEDEGPPADEDLSEAAIKVLDRLKESYKRLTDGVARNRTLPTERGFEGDAIISTHTELVLVDQYIRLEAQEASQFRQMVGVLERVPIYVEYLKGVTGVGPAMAGVLLTYLDPHRAPRVSSFWAYAGLDVGPDGRGRSRRKEHLVERSYTDRSGKPATRVGITYQPFLKTKVMGVLGGSFLRTGSPWRQAYDGYKHRIETDPARVKIEVGAWKKAHAAGEPTEHLWTPGRIHTAATRYMVKMFLADFWAKWRALEGLEVTPTYHEAKQGHQHAA